MVSAIRPAFDLEGVSLGGFLSARNLASTRLEEFEIVIGRFAPCVEICRSVAFSVVFAVAERLNFTKLRLAGSSFCRFAGGELSSPA